MRSRFAAFACILLSALNLSGRIYGQVASVPPGATTTDGSGQTETQASPLEVIETAMQGGNYDKSRGLLDAYLSAHPTDARALFDRGYCDDAQGKTAQASDYYRKAIAADPKQFESRLALGLILAKQGDPGAGEQLKAAATLEPNPSNPAAKGQALRALARLVRETDPDTAKEALIGALKITPETTDDTLLAAEIAEAEGNKEVAEQAYRRVLAVEPQSSAAIAGLVHLLLEEKKYSEAEPLLRTALVRDPDDPALNAQYAALLAAEGKTSDAVRWLEKLHQLQPQDRHVAKMLADAYVEAGNLDQADALYGELLAGSPADAELESARGQVLIQEQKYSEALDLLQNAVKIRQDDPDIWGGIAFAASKTQQSQLVIDALTMRSKFATETPATYFLRATANDKMHRNKQALEYYQLFLKSASGKFPNEEWQARQRIAILMR
jgi:tetratricopeptide (TPR) repeat protein